MYPSIIDRYNLSPETLGCTCGEYHEVPELGYRVCERRRGLIPKVVEPIVERRQRYKELYEKKIFARRADVLKWLLVTCFGYTGYKKARFSNIEVHESITAYGREVLLTAAETAQEMGYSVVHGIVDSLWLKGDEDKLERLIKKVNKKTDITLENEGKYSWVVFLPSKTDPEIGVPNRYYGKLNGEMECKGIHMKRSDTPPFFKEVQKELIGLMEEKGTGCTEEMMKTMKKYYLHIAQREVPINKLVFTKTVSKRAEDYEHMTESKAALMQYEQHNTILQPGQTIKYVVTDGRSRDHREKVAVLHLTEPPIHYDKKYYEKYLYRVVEEILTPFGFNEERIKKEVKS